MTTTSTLLRRTLSLLTASVVAGTVLTACSGVSPRPADETPNTRASGDTTATTSPSHDGATPADDPRASPSGSSVGDDGDAGDAGGNDGSDGSDNGDGDGGGGGADSGAGLEMPEVPEEEVASLSELLEPASTAPLVSAPLPRPASARGRLVVGFPAVLRPTPGTAVESSSVSPSGHRLQAGLTGSSSRSPDAVLLGYRTRWTRRGLLEQAAPVAAPGSWAAAFRRGRSVVTLTVSTRGSRTTYVVHASLRAEDD
ncbi:hypothetical protein CFI00_18985 [Nocardioides sp. S5]|uniref:hypothetical protein n=1 Tax=Nocardioides sp. S5 TaxID=2017486 RepID=UPI001A9031D9|nr:hypothetical protein [Nocardioides sp. S5]QSR32538.1 hypothetical protein CFI00_18985 [Nocardioides sp. S5]